MFSTTIPPHLGTFLVATSLALNIPLSSSLYMAIPSDVPYPPAADPDRLFDTFLARLRTASITISPHHQFLLRNFLRILSTSPLSETILPPIQLLTTSIPRTLHIGHGLSITDQISASIASAQAEVLFSTCFWASSASRDVLASSLLSLARSKRRVRVRIGFSSSGIAQKLFHPQTPQGKLYSPSQWLKLGIPPREQLEQLDLQVKSIFHLPFSVLHSKFVIIDRKLLFLPSANISWETWLEQCIAFSGNIVDVFVKFWDKIWGDGDPLPPIETGAASPDIPRADVNTMTLEEMRCATVFLPQPHHRNPRFRIPWCFPAAEPAATPQNVFLLQAVETARRSVYVHTPNLTCDALISALCDAARRGVKVEIVTVKRMMLLEQLVTTAGMRTTEGCVRRLVAAAGESGNLGVWYYTGAAKKGDVEDHAGETARATVKSHVKAVVLDGEITVVGSANADRASWYTSQEVNVAVFGSQLAVAVRAGLVRGLGGRLERVCGVGELEM
jgi:phosphatidylserine/phosphatidylglycerophosphate/cardiolipin synthase-like enzyme